MFIVQTYVASSAIEGLGVFASVPIKKGETVWIFEPAFDRLYSQEQVAQLPAIAQKHVHKCGFLDKRTGMYLLGIDYDIFTNHSDDATLVESLTDEDVHTPRLIAARDIAQGEELTQNYYEYDEPHDIKRKFDGS